MEKQMNFGHAKFVRDLVWFDGLLLSVCELRDKTYLVKWVDVVEEETRSYNIWLFYEVEPEILGAYIGKALTLRQVEERSPAVFVQEGFAEDGGAAYTDYDDIPEDWKASCDSYYDESLGHDES